MTDRTQPGNREERREESRVVAMSLRIGAFGSVALIVIGMVMGLFAPGAASQVTRAGFLLLLFTPALRIVVAGYMYFHERDYRYVWISIGVFCIMFGTAILAMLKILPSLEH